MDYIATEKQGIMITIENEYLTVKINPKGAELTSVFNKETQLEYMWSGDPAVWPKHSPILFPIVGTLKNNTYLYEGIEYKLSRHGFARGKHFVVADHQKDECVFILIADKDTKALYPFDFRLRIKYSLLESSVSVTYEVLNTNAGELYFSLGAHPAFKLPLVPGTGYEDYSLEFETAETAPRWPITSDGLIDAKPIPVLENSKVLPLSKDLFNADALVFKSLRSSSVKLYSKKTPHGLEFKFPGFPYLGVWAVKGGDFICIEPWCGIADGVGTDQLLQHKEGINKLAHGEKFARTWTATFF